MTRRMWVLGLPLRCPMSELLLCTPAGRRASCCVTACPRQEGRGRPHLATDSPLPSCDSHIIPILQRKLFRQALFGVCFLGHQADWRAADASLSLVIGQRNDAPQILDIHGSWRAVVGQSRRERPHRFCPVHGESPKRRTGSPLRQLSEGGTRTICHEQLLHDMSKADSRLVRSVGG